MCFFFFSFHRPICLTSKCTHTSLLSLRPPPSGAAVRGFAAAVFCYDVKTTTPPFPPCPSYTLSAACILTPTCCPPVGPQSQSTCWFPSPFGAAEREPNNATGSWGKPPKKHSQISPPHIQYMHDRFLHKIICRHSNTQINS